MGADMRKLAVGNWKMNGVADDLDEVTALIAANPAPSCEMVLCLPATLLRQATERAAGSALAIGAQDCHHASAGAHTGDLSAAMLHEAGARYVIVGHSERRQNHGETDSLVAAKALAALLENMAAIVCLGETRAEREAGATLDVVARQLTASVHAEFAKAWEIGAALVVAYEPVWSIGTGLTPTLDEIAEVHGFLRSRLVERVGPTAAAVRILYGGSVKPGNAAEIFALPNVDGALVGGASLKASDFSKIVLALDASPLRD